MSSTSKAKLPIPSPTRTNRRTNFLSVPMGLRQQVFFYAFNGAFAIMKWRNRYRCHPICFVNGDWAENSPLVEDADLEIASCLRLKLNKVDARIIDVRFIYK